MSKRIVTALGITPLILAGSLTFLPQSALAHEEGRYTMLETKNGVIRLDRKTGAMTTCVPLPNGWKCEPLVKKGAGAGADQDRVTELEDENFRLKQKLAERSDDDLNDPDSEPKKFKLPSDEEVDEAIEYMERMIRKFGGAMKRLRENNSEDELEL